MFTMIITFVAMVVFVVCLLIFAATFED